MENLILRTTFGIYIISGLFYVAWAIVKKDGLVRTARIALIAGILVHSAGIIVRWLVAGYPPFSNLYESLIVFALAITVIFLLMDFKYNLKQAGGFACLLSLLLLIYASRLDNEIRPLMPALKSNWLVTHVLTCFIGYAAFAVSFICSVMYLAHGRRRSPAFAERLDTVTSKAITLGFLFLTIGIMTGSVWANRAWGRYWGWDPKETWALITWLIYAFYLHMRVVKGWKGKLGAWIAIIGFSAVMFTYLGVSYLQIGLHSYTN